MGGGLYAALLVAVRSHGNQPNGSAADTQWVGGWPKAHGPLCLGKHQCISSPPSSLEYSPPRDGPPNTRGPLEVLVGLTDSYRSSGLSWETSPQTDSTPEASNRSGSGRIELSSKSTTFLMWQFLERSNEEQSYGSRY